MDTPSGSWVRRARWKGTLSKFDLEIIYSPGPENYVADAMFGWAYTASFSKENVSIQGSLEACNEIAKTLDKEHVEERLIGIIRRKNVGESQFWESSKRGVLLDEINRTLSDTRTV